MRVKTDRRVGKFKIDLDLLDFHPEVVKDLTERMVITRAEALWHSMKIEYYAVSDLFDEVPVWENAPEYILSCDMAGNVTAERVIQ